MAIKILLNPFKWIILGILSFFKAIALFFKWVSIGLVKVFVVIFNYIWSVFKYDYIFVKTFFKYVFDGFSFIFIKPFKRKPKKISAKSIATAAPTPVLKVDNLKIKDAPDKKPKIKIPKTKDEKNKKEKIEKKEKIKNSKLEEKELKKKIEEEKSKTKNIKYNQKIDSKKMLDERNKLLSELGKDVKREDKKTTYRYVAKNSDGQIVKGTFVGFSKLDVNSFLVNEGYTVYQIKSSKWIDFLYGQSNTFGIKMKNKDLIFWLTQLATYIKAGIPLTESMRILSRQMKNKGKKRIFENVVYQLTLGESFSKALEKQGNVFPSLLINMLKAAEATGELEETLDEMAEYYTEIESTRKQMVSAMTYPSIITVFSIAVITFILLYVIPQFINVYDQAGIKIHGFTLAIVNISQFLKENISFILLGVIFIVGIIVFLYKKVKAFRMILQRLFMKMPVVGKIIIYNEITIFTKTFSSLLKNNVLITESIGILSKVTRNEVYKIIMYNTISNITKGEKISEAFKNHWAIPEVAYYMIVTGESTGELAEMMATVSRYYQEQHRNLVNSLKAFIEPIMIVSLAVIVGTIILAVIIPMFDLYNSIS